MLCAVHILNEVFVLQTLLDNQINFSAKDFLQLLLKIEVVGDVIPLLMVGCIKVDKQIHITLVVEPIGEDRAKDSQCLDPVLPAKVDNPLHIQFNQLHKR